MSAMRKVEPKDLQTVIQRCDDVQASRGKVDVLHNKMEVLKAQMEGLKAQMDGLQRQFDEGRNEFNTKADGFTPWLSESNLLPHFQKILGKQDPSPQEIYTASREQLRAEKPEMLKANYDVVIPSRIIDEVADGMLQKASSDPTLLQVFSSTPEDDNEIKKAKILAFLRSPLLVDSQIVQKFIDTKVPGFSILNPYDFAFICGYDIGDWGPNYNKLIPIKKKAE